MAFHSKKQALLNPFQNLNLAQLVMFTQVSIPGFSLYTQHLSLCVDIPPISDVLCQRSLGSRRVQVNIVSRGGTKVLLNVLNEALETVR